MIVIGDLIVKSNPIFHCIYHFRSHHSSACSYSSPGMPCRTLEHGLPTSTSHRSTCHTHSAQRASSCNYRLVTVFHNLTSIFQKMCINQHLKALRDSHPIFLRSQIYQTYRPSQLLSAMPSDGLAFYLWSLIFNLLTSQPDAVDCSHDSARSSVTAAAPAEGNIIIYLC